MEAEKSPIATFAVTGRIYPATIGVLPAFLARIGRKYPDIKLHISSGSTNDIIRGLENGQINLGFIRPVENIGSLRFFSIAHERYLLAVEKNSALLARSEIGIEDLQGEKIISFSSQNLSYTERYFAEKFEERFRMPTRWPLARHKGLAKATLSRIGSVSCVH